MWCALTWCELVMRSRTQLRRFSLAIHFISGKPRAGKSLYAVKLLVDELVFGSRVIITNLPLQLGRLNEYLQQKYPDRCIDVINRVILLTDDETQHFYTVRPNGVRIPRMTDQDWKAGLRPDYSGVTDRGVFYAIDEVHIFFNARAWAETGKDVLYYLSQHGKLGDTVLCVTQHVGNVDKQFRSVTQDYTYLRNLTKEKMGLFTMPAIFVRKTYPQPATGTNAPMETGTFRLDVSGLASCYDTAQGVGIHGRSGADKAERKRGLHWSVFVVGLPVLLVCIYLYVPKALAGLMTPVTGTTARLAETQANALASSSGAAIGANLPTVAPTAFLKPGKVMWDAEPLPAAPGQLAATNNRPVTITGVMGFGASLVASLSDGRVLYSKKGEVRFNAAGAVVVCAEPEIPPFKL